MMFGMNRRLKVEMEYLKSRLENLNDRHLDLYRSHNSLLRELGYFEDHVLEHKVLRKKGGPEKGESQ